MPSISKSASQLMLCLIILQVPLLMSAFCDSGQSRSGVARIEESQAPEVPLRPKEDIAQESPTATGQLSNGSIEESLADSPQSTDEEIAMEFAGCMREHGFNVIDPELNADGSVNLMSLRSSLMQDPSFDPQNDQSGKSLEDCLPLLRGASFARQPSGEDEVELQDSLLEFAQCLRENGLDVPDPDFSKGTRASMRDLVQGIEIDRSKAQEMIELCTNRIFSSGRLGRR